MNLKHAIFFYSAAVFTIQAHANNLDQAQNFEEGYVAETFAVAATSNSMEICANTPVPAGWVVTAVYAGCGTGTGRWVIEKLDVNRGSMEMCALSPVPAGWVVDSVYAGCNLTGYGLYRIVPVNTNFNEMRMCNVPTAQVPPGWVVTYTDSGCGLPGYAEYRIQYARPSYGTMSMCAFSPIPQGWTVIATEPGCRLPGNAGVRIIRYGF